MNELDLTKAIEAADDAIDHCSTCRGSREIECMAHVAGDVCENLVLACPDCVETRDDTAEATP